MQYRLWLCSVSTKWVCQLPNVTGPITDTVHNIACWVLILECWAVVHNSLTHENCLSTHIAHSHSNIAVITVSQFISRWWLGPELMKLQLLKRNPARCVCLIMICIWIHLSAHWLFITDKGSHSTTKCTLHVYTLRTCILSHTHGYVLRIYIYIWVCTIWYCSGCWCSTHYGVWSLPKWVCGLVQMDTSYHCSTQVT